MITCPKLCVFGGRGMEVIKYDGLRGIRRVRCARWLDEGNIG